MPRIEFQYACHDGIDNRKECPEIELGKQQRTLVVECEYVLYYIHLTKVVSMLIVSVNIESAAGRG